MLMFRSEQICYNFPEQIGVLITFTHKKIRHFIRTLRTPQVFNPLKPSGKYVYYLL
jgi:hypothetical protein